MIKKAKEYWFSLYRFIEKWEVLIVILLGAAILHIPSLFEPNHYGDEDIYLAVGMGLRKGLLLYRDIFDHKPPLIYWMAALAGNVVWFKIMLFVVSLIGIVGMWKLAEKILKNNWALFISTTVYALLTSLPFLEGNIVNAELFMIVPVIWGLVWLLKANKEEWEYLGVGMLMGVGLLMKVPVVMDFLGIALWFLVFQRWSFKNLKRTVLMGIGFAIPTLVTMAYFGSLGVIVDYFKVVWGFNFTYISAFEGGRKPMLWESGLFQRAVVLLMATAGVVATNKWLKKDLGLILLWMVWTVFGVTLSGRPYPHYWIQVVPAASLLVGALAVEERKKVMSGMILGVALVGLAVWRYGFWHYPTISYYQNFLEKITRQKDLEEYKNYFGKSVARNEKIAKFIKERTESNDRILVWGTEPAIYVLADRAPVGRYVVSFHVKDLKAYDEILDKTRELKPKFVVVMDYEERFRGLEEELNIHYLQVLKLDGATIYRRMD